MQKDSHLGVVPLLVLWKRSGSTATPTGHGHRREHPPIRPSTLPREASCQAPVTSCTKVESVAVSASVLQVAIHVLCVAAT